jgi:VWFA-related protein
MSQNATVIRRATTELLKNLAPADLARVGTFGNEIMISPEFTRDVASLVSLLPDQIYQYVPTPLWTAIDQALGEFGSAPPGRRVVLVITDSKDSGPPPGKPFMTPVQISQRAQREDVMIYGVGLRSAISAGMNVQAAIANSFPDPSLGELADDTGGGYFELKVRENMTETFARVAEELRRQYMIGFAPPLKDGKNHKIEVKVTGAGLKPRARKSYTAPK